MDYDLTLPEEREKAQRKALRRLARGREIFGVLSALCLSFAWIVISKGDWRTGIDYNALTVAAFPLLGAILSGWVWRVVVRRAAQYAADVGLPPASVPADRTGDVKGNIRLQSAVETQSDIEQENLRAASVLYENVDRRPRVVWGASLKAVAIALCVLGGILVFTLGFLYMLFSVGAFLPSPAAKNIAQVVAIFLAAGFFLRAATHRRGGMTGPPRSKFQMLDLWFAAVLYPIFAYFIMTGGVFAALNTAVGTPQKIHMEVIRHMPTRCASIPGLAADRAIFCTDSAAFPAGRPMRVDVVLKTSLFGVDIVGAEVDGVFIKNLHRFGS